MNQRLSAESVKFKLTGTLPAKATAILTMAAIQDEGINTPTISLVSLGLRCDGNSILDKATAAAKVFRIRKLDSHRICHAKLKWMSFHFINKGQMKFFTPGAA